MIRIISIFVPPLLLLPPWHNMVLPQLQLPVLNQKRVTKQLNPFKMASISSHQSNGMMQGSGGNERICGANLLSDPIQISEDPTCQNRDFSGQVNYFNIR